MRFKTNLMLFTSILLFLTMKFQGSQASDYRLNDDEEKEGNLNNFNYNDKNEGYNQESLEEVKESDDKMEVEDFYSNEDIELALSGLTVAELQLLSELVDQEDNVKSKRDTSKLKKKHKLSNKERIEDEEEADYDSDYIEKSSSKKLLNCRGLCKGNCIHNTREIEDEEEKNENESQFIKRRTIPFKKRNSEATEKKIQARISSLRDRAKLHSFALVSKPAKQSDDFNYEPQIREKRSLSTKYESKADDPQSPEHLKLLEESFPNAASVNTFHQPDFNLVRVKRDDQ